MSSSTLHGLAGLFLYPHRISLSTVSFERDGLEVDEEEEEGEEEEEDWHTERARAKVKRSNSSYDN